MSVWEKITVRQYLEMLDIEQNKNIDDFEKQVKLLCVIDNKKETDYDNVKYKDFLERLKVVTDEIRKIPTPKAQNYISVNGNRYKFVHELNELTAGQFIDFNHFAKDIMNYNKTCSVFFLGMKGERVCAYGEIPQDKIAEDFLDAKFIEVHGCMLFFYHLLIESTLRMLYSSEKMVETMKREMDNSMQIGVGNIHLN
jgi:hypothetical protein